MLYEITGCIEKFQEVLTINKDNLAVYSKYRRLDIRAESSFDIYKQRSDYIIIPNESDVEFDRGCFPKILKTLPCAEYEESDSFRHKTGFITYGKIRWIHVPLPTSVTNGKRKILYIHGVANVEVYHELFKQIANITGEMRNLKYHEIRIGYKLALTVEENIGRIKEMLKI